MAEVVLVSGPHLVLTMAARWGGWMFGLISFYVPPFRGGLAVQRLCILGVWALWPPRRTATGVFAWGNVWLVVRGHTLLQLLGL